jgi:outer membrane biosynthesis protein TonB
MRARRLTVLATLALLAALGWPAIARAAKVEDLVATAIQQGLSCQPPGSGYVFCSQTTRVANSTVLIRPETGQEEDLETTVQPPQGVTALDAASIDFMATMHAAACGAPNAVHAYVEEVGKLDQLGSVPGRSIGTCAFTGGYEPAIEGPPYYVVRSRYVEPPPPTPTPEPTPKPTKKPPTPTVEPTATPKLSPTPALTLSPTPTVVPSPTPAPPDPVPTPPRPTELPTQQVAAATDVPGATAPPPAAPGPPPPGPHTFAGSVVALTELNTEPAALGGSLLLALLLLLIVAFVGELFNNTVENNYDVIAAWFRKGPLGSLRRGLDRIRFDPPGHPGVLLFIALTALVSSFVDPTFGLDLRSVAVFLGFLIGLVVVLASFKLPPILARRRRTGEVGRLRPLPWALLIAALFVVVSRLGNLQPGYLYGIVLGAIFVTDVTDRDEGRETFYGALWTLVAALLAWAALTWIRGLGLPEDGFGATLLETAFAAILVAGLEAAAFALMPLRFLPGYTLYRWNRPVWALLWGAGLFTFFHILIGPTSGYVSELSPAAFIAALGVFAAFGAMSIATWLYFRVRSPRRPPEAAG